MPITRTRINFDMPVNSSLQVGDAIYVSDVSHDILQSGLELSGIISEPIYAEKAIDVGIDYIIIDKDPTTPPVITLGPMGNNYIFFAKNININESSLKGYYADVTFENSSNKRTELFAISSEVVPSSK